MPRAYTIATAALTLGISPKWLDNTLSHYKVAGVVQEKQGVARRISVEGLLLLTVTLLFTTELGLATAKAIELAKTVIAADGAFNFRSGMRIKLDLENLRTEILSQLERAVEVAPLPRRGRPPKNTTGRLD